MNKKAMILMLISIFPAWSQAGTIHNISHKDKKIAGKKVLIKKIKEIAPAETGITQETKIKPNDISPQTSITGLLKKIPGMNVITSGAGNFSPQNTQFTYQGFTSSQIAQNFDGVPITNPLNGGAGGTNGVHASTPLLPSQVQGVTLYSGSNSPSQNGLNSLGGTINYSPLLPINKFYVDVNNSIGSYLNSGPTYGNSLTVNSGKINGIGTKILFNYTHKYSNSFFNNVYANINSYYFSAVQPYNHGLSQVKFIALDNAENSQTPYLIPTNLINIYGRGFQFPNSVSSNSLNANNLLLIGSWKSIFNRYLVAGAKVFYESQDYQRLGYANAEYVSNEYPGFVFYDGYPVHTVLYNYSTPTTDAPSSVNTYNPVEEFGSGYNGSQYHGFIFNTSTMGAKAHVGVILPNNYISIGGSIIDTYINDRGAWYGSAPVPIIQGYNSDFGQQFQRNIFNSYIEDRLSLLNHKLVIYPGVKDTITDTHVSIDTGYLYPYGGEFQNSYNFISPSVGFDYKIDKNLNIYGSTGIAYKAPDADAYYTAIEYTPIAVPNTVKPEKTINFNLGARYSTRTYSISASLFKRYFSEIFNYYLNPSTDIVYVNNNGSAVYQGITFNGEAKINNNFTLGASYTYTSAKYSTTSIGANDSVFSGQYRPYVPLITANAFLQFKKGNFSAEVSSTLIGRQYIKNNAGATLGKTLPAYNVVNASIGYNYPMHGIVDDIDFKLYADNITNTNYLQYEVEELGSPFNYYAGTSGAPTFIGGSLNVKFD